MFMKPADGGGADVRPKYPQIVQFVAETPWAILPSKLQSIVELISLRARGERFTDDEIAARLDNRASREAVVTVPQSVSVLPLYGSLVPRGDMLTKMSGATSMDAFGRAFQAAVENPQISAIIIDVDSPGGTVTGTQELGDLIYEARGTKPIVAIANKMACSAAYWIASQADEFVASPSATLGSVGVLIVHNDLSKALEMEGVDVTVIQAGRRKAEGNPWKPLSDDAKQNLQERVDVSYAKFVEAVANGRGVTVEQVMSNFGEGGVVSADYAASVGMVDRIETFEDTVARLLAASQSSENLTTPAYNGAKANLSFADQATAARDAVSALVARTRSLAEYRDRGRLTAAKRGQLLSLLDSLGEAHETVAGLLADTDTDKHTHAEVGAAVIAALATTATA